MTKYCGNNEKHKPFHISKVSEWGRGEGGLVTVHPFSSQGPARKKQRGRGFQHLEMSELSAAVNPRSSRSPHWEISPVLFTRPDQHPSAAASDLVSFGGSDNGELDDSLSLAASDAEELAGSPPPPSQSAQPSTSSPGMDDVLFRDLSNAVEGLGLEWSPPEEPSRSRLDSCQGAIRPLVNELHHSFQRSVMRLQSLGVHPTRPAYVPLLPLPSLWSTVQKKKVTTTCLPWMSQWPRISARPRPLAGRQKQLTHLSHAGLLQLSLDEPIHRLDMRPLRFTPWSSCKCSRQISSILWTSWTRTPAPSKAPGSPAQDCGGPNSSGVFLI